MRNLIVTDISSGLTATSADTNYPVTFLLNNRPSIPWKCVNGVYDADLDFILPAGCAAICLTNTNATDISIDIVDTLVSWDPGEVSFAAGTDWYQYGGLEALFYTNDVGVSSIWIDIPPAAYARDITLNLSLGSGTLYAGTLYAGPVHIVPDPLLGMRQRFYDHSIIREYNDGSPEIVDRPRVREFDITIELERDDDFFDFMNIFRESGRNPSPWKMTSQLQSSEWIMLGRFLDSPEGAHNQSIHSTISMKFREVL